MPLFRWRFGARNSGTSVAAECTPPDDKTPPPPSYEESQDASLRAVLQGAIAIAPVLWPSAYSHDPICDAPSPLKAEDECRYSDVGGKDREKKDAERTTPSLSVVEDTIMEVLTNLAMVPCGSHPFLDRVREFSDFYFTPYIASEGAAIPSSSQESGSGRSIQEQQRQVLENLDVPRESTALVLCARVLDDYYAGLGHVDSGVGVGTVEETSAPYQQFPNEKATSSGVEAANKIDENPAKLTRQTRIKTKLTQMTPCLEQGCTCCDYNESNPKLNLDQPPSQHCGCGHTQTSHAPSPLGISRLLRRYTNWNSSAYSALRHRSSTGQAKRRIHDIKVCGACPCRDYDKGRRTGRCGRCGHYYEEHIPIKAAWELDTKRTKKRDKGKGKANDASTTTGGSDSKNAEWELSWILVENGYRLLNHITTISRSKLS